MKYVIQGNARSGNGLSGNCQSRKCLAKVISALVHNVVFIKFNDWRIKERC